MQLGAGIGTASRAKACRLAHITSLKLAHTNAREPWNRMSGLLLLAFWIVVFVGKIVRSRRPRRPSGTIAHKYVRLTPS